MFCDLVDSTGIAAKLDAEEWRDLVGAYIDAASAAVVENGGKVPKKLGDGLMALFGYPVPGARPYPAWSADEAWPRRNNDPRLQTSRHNQNQNAARGPRPICAP
jgi:class 3 adenylate cyclase